MLAPARGGIHTGEQDGDAAACRRRRQRYGRLSRNQALRRRRKVDQGAIGWVAEHLRSGIRIGEQEVAAAEVAGDYDGDQTDKNGPVEAPAGHVGFGGQEGVHHSRQPQDAQQDQDDNRGQADVAVGEELGREDKRSPRQPICQQEQGQYCGRRKKCRRAALAGDEALAQPGPHEGKHRRQCRRVASALGGRQILFQTINSIRVGGTPL